MHNNALPILVRDLYYAVIYFNTQIIEKIIATFKLIKQIINQPICEKSTIYDHKPFQ